MGNFPVFSRNASGCRLGAAVDLLLDAGHGAFILLGALLLLGSNVTVALAQDNGAYDASVPSALLLVTYDRAAEPAQVTRDFTDHGFVIEKIWPEFNLASIRVAASTSAEMNARLQAASATLDGLPVVQTVSQDEAVYAALYPQFMGDQVKQIGGEDDPPASLNGDEIPNDPLTPEQWSITQMHVIDGWKISRGNPHIVVAVIDSGYDVAHEDLAVESLWLNPAEAAGRFQVDDDGNGLVDDLHGWDWIENDGVTNDPYGHGTHVGGSIAASTNNRAGIAGLGGNLRIMPLRILDEYGAGRVSDLIDALYYAHDHGARIINLSLVLRVESPALGQAIKALAEQNVLVLAATGNQDGPVLWPAAYPETLAVAATDQTDGRAPFSNYGPEVDIAAPGVAILAPFLDGTYVRQDGTSMATPHVSALAGLLWSIRPDLDAAGVRALILSTADDANRRDLPGPDINLGAGRIDFASALRAATAAINVAPLDDTPLAVAQGNIIEVDLLASVLAAPGDATQPVMGAMAQYRVTSAAESDAAVASSGWTLSDEDGLLKVVFTAPPEAGAYLLHIQVGAIEQQLPLEVFVAPNSLSISATPSTVGAGSEPIALAIDLRNAAGDYVAEPATVELAASLGHFGEGESATKLVIENGRGEVWYTPGIAAGIAQVAAVVGSTSARLEIEVTPDTAAAITFPALPERIMLTDRPVSVSITCLVQDRFGNPVADGTAVSWSASAGHITPAAATTVSGTARADLLLAPGVDSPLRIEVDAADGATVADVEIPLLTHHLWIPIVSR